MTWLKGEKGDALTRNSGPDWNSSRKLEREEAAENRRQSKWINDQLRAKGILPPLPPRKNRRDKLEGRDELEKPKRAPRTKLRDLPVQEQVHTSRAISDLRNKAFEEQLQKDRLARAKEVLKNRRKTDWTQLSMEEQNKIRTARATVASAADRARQERVLALARQGNVAPDLDHLRRENAIPATPPKPNAEPESELTPKQWRQQEDRDAVEDQERDEADHRFREDSPSRGGHDVSGQKRVPAGEGERGGEWTK